MTAFVLVHSPLVGPLTWALAADELKRRGVQMIVPELTSDARSLPYWKQHILAVERALEPVPKDRRLVLVGHSGAGMLLPAIRQYIDRPVAGYIFVDAGIPKNGWSRLDFFSRDHADTFRQAASGGFIPNWTDPDLRDVILDNDVRRRFVAELRPL